MVAKFAYFPFVITLLLVLYWQLLAAVVGDQGLISSVFDIKRR